MTNDEAVKLAKSQFLKVTEAAINAALLASPMAVVEAPPWCVLTHEMVHWVASKIVDDAEVGLFFAYINFNVNQAGHSFLQAVYQNQQAQLKGSEEEKNVAIKNLEDSFSKLVVLRN